MKQKKGFTLIELLVVISIIALLVSILTPALSKAKHQARKAVCGAHEHSLAQAYVMYASDNEDRIIRIESAQPFNMTNRSGFGGWKENRHLFEPYTTPEIFYCPAMGNGLGVKEASDNADNTSYGKDKFCGWSAVPVGQPGDYYVAIGYSMLAGWSRLNEVATLKYLSGDGAGNLQDKAAGAKEMPSHLSSLKSPSTAPLLTDIAFTPWPASVADVVSYDWEPYTTSSYYGSSMEVNYALNHIHSGRVFGINTAYADGHVEWNSEKDIYPRAWYTFGEYFFWY